MKHKKAKTQKAILSAIFRKVPNQESQSMNKILNIKIFLCSCIFVLMFSCTNEEEGIFFNETYEMKVAYSELELQILDNINDYRVTKNLQPLNRLNSISSVALSHTNYMIETGMVSHDNFPDRNYFLKTNENAKSVGENIAYGFNSAQGVVKAWINSEAHRAIIENENYTDFGISIEKNSEGRNFFTQIFIVK